MTCIQNLHLHFGKELAQNLCISVVDITTIIRINQSPRKGHDAMKIGPTHSLLAPFMTKVLPAHLTGSLAANGNEPISGTASLSTETGNWNFTVVREGSDESGRTKFESRNCRIAMSYFFFGHQRM